MKEKFLEAAKDDLAFLFERWSRTKLAQRCESPIELHLLAAMTLYPALGAWAANAYARIHLSDFPPNGDSSQWPIATIIPQFQLGNFRVDFALFWQGGKQFVVECDGHDFHERTAEQAERDRSRDRLLQERGIPILRFTGREIYRDPFKCAQEVFLFAERQS